jgi:uncharacterized protein YbjT (DUF2867 family)
MIAPAKPIFVVGATGRHGGTGTTVARILLARGVPVRALVRTIDERVAPLKALGAQIVVGDLHERSSLIEALDGIETAFFTYPISVGVVDAAANFASAGRAAGLKRTVVMSMAPAHPQSPSHLGRAQWLAEELFQWAGSSCLHLRIAALFFENLELFHRAEIENEGVIRNAFSDIPISWLSGEDAARVAVAALLYPERFGSDTAVYPGAPVQYTQSDVARIVGDYLGRTLRHEIVSQEAWRDSIVGLGSTDDRVSPDMAAHISAVAASLARPFPPNDMILTVTGKAPISLEEALESKRLVLGSRKNAETLI